MSDDKPPGPQDADLLSQTLKAVRKHRAMSPREVAAAMNMATRTYQRFEAGTNRLNIDYIHRFARATRSDPHAIMMAVWIGSPDHARRACDNQLGTILTVALRNFDDTVGDDIRRLDSRTLVAAIVAMFEDLATTLAPTDPARAWLKQGTEDLAARRPGPGR